VSSSPPCPALTPRRSPSSPRPSLASPRLRDSPPRHARPPPHAHPLRASRFLAPAMTPWTRTSAWSRSCSCQPPPQPPQAPHTSAQTPITKAAPPSQRSTHLPLTHPWPLSLLQLIRSTSPRCSSSSNSRPLHSLPNPPVFPRTLLSLSANPTSTVIITIPSP
jgi:hypothetical protein